MSKCCTTTTCTVKIGGTIINKLSLFLMNSNIPLFFICFNFIIIFLILVHLSLLWNKQVFLYFFFFLFLFMLHFFLLLFFFSKFLFFYFFPCQSYNTFSFICFEKSHSALPNHAKSLKPVPHAFTSILPK